MRVLDCTDKAGITRASNAEEVSDTPLDNVCMQEQRLGLGRIGWVGLNHSDPMHRAVDKHRDN